MGYLIVLALIVWAFSFGPVVGLLALIALLLIGGAK